MFIDLGNVDWELLSDQKKSLLNAITAFENFDGDEKTLLHLNGIVDLIDHIQDEAEMQTIKGLKNELL